MRYAAVLTACLLCQLMFALPVVQSVLNTSVYEVSASEIRCVTGYYDPTALNTHTTHMKLWNIEDPLHPVGGTTIFEEMWNGWMVYRQPTIYQNLLLYMDNFHLHVLDIGNVQSPVQTTQLPLAETYCFTVLGHYLILGKQDGTLELRDLGEPSQLSLVGTVASLPSIWMLSSCGDKLAVRCGNYSNNTAKLYALEGENLAELVSVTLSEQIAYVGEWNGMLLLQTVSGDIRAYDYPQAGMPQLVAYVAAEDAPEGIIAEGDKLVSLDAGNCVRIWQWDGQDGLEQAGCFDLGHLGMEQGGIFQLRNGQLLFTVDTVLCLWLDIADLSPEPACVYTLGDGVDYRSIAIPGSGNKVYYERIYALNALKTAASGQLLPDGEVPGLGNILKVEACKDHLYCLAPEGNSFRLKCLNVQDPTAPVVFADIPLQSDAFFNMQGSHLYTGTLTQIDRYNLDNSGQPVWQKQLSYFYNEPGWGYHVYFYDANFSGGADYGVGVFGSWMVGYHPIFVYWLPDGRSGCYRLSNFYDKVVVLDDYIYLLGYGIYAFQINSVRQPQPVGTFFTNSLFDGFRSAWLLEERYLFANNLLTNNIYLFDLQDRREPLLTHTFHQSGTSYELGVSTNLLLSASGSQGIKAYALQDLVSVCDEQVPPALQLTAYPNPFAGEITLRFVLEKASPARMECFNIRGQLVYSRYLQDAKSGENIALWDGRDQAGRDCPCGVYIIRVSSSAGAESRKVTKLLRK